MSGDAKYEMGCSADAEKAAVDSAMQINSNDYDTLLRVPGIGITYARRIIEARRYSFLSFDTLKQMKISLKNISLPAEVNS